LNNMQDDGFHEIQLNGKQLVFLFMAATVVSVVIFLIGVMVGRSVGEQRASAAEVASLNELPPNDVQPATAPPDAPPPGSDPTKAAAPTAVEDLSYFNRLEGEKQPAEAPNPEPTKPTAVGTSTGGTKPAPAAPPAAPPSAPTAAKAAPAPSTPATMGGQSWSVQIASFAARPEADAMAARWKAKGYPAYVPPPAAETTNFRVRIGPYKTKRDADSIAAKLAKEEQLKGWVAQP
jgi:cell division septation protein DedD